MAYIDEVPQSVQDVVSVMCGEIYVPDLFWREMKRFRMRIRRKYGVIIKQMNLYVDEVKPS